MDFNEEEILRLLNRLFEELHQADGNNKKGSTVINIYGKGSQHIDNVENQYIYGNVGSKQVKDNSETPPHDLPPALSTEEAMVLWRKAQKAGYVDENFQPRISRTQAALLADAIANRLNIKQKWKVFEILWNRKNIRGDYYRALYQQQYSDFIDEINIKLA